MDKISDRHNSVNQGRSRLPSPPNWHCWLQCAECPCPVVPPCRPLKTRSCFESAAIVPGAEACRQTPGSQVDACQASILRSASEAASLEVFSNSRASL
jgi:hypothetical protein